VDRRIFGIETEYGVTCTFKGQRRLSPDEVARYLFRRVVSWGRSSNVFLRNGARLYLDVGSHPEYATAECDSLVQLVTHDRAGEWVLEDLLIDPEVEDILINGHRQVYVSRRGKLVAIQYLERATGRWRPALVVRTDAKGRFDTSYRFRYVTGVARIRLRATAPAEGGWPFARGSSSPVTITVSSG